MTKAESAASRTPRTDAECEETCGDYYLDGYVDSDFARTLELEAADLRERLAKAEADARHVRQANENYRRENQIAVERLAKAEALAKQRNAVSDLLMDRPTELLGIMMDAHDAHSFWSGIDALTQKGQS